MTPTTPRKADAEQTRVKVHHTEAHHAPARVPEHILRVATLLAGNVQRKRSDLRKHQRHQLVAPCTVTVDSTTGVVKQFDAYVRNIALGGLGLLMRETHSIGEVVEVKLVINGKPKFVCGVVVFCRHIEGSVYDIGVQLYQSSVAPQLAEMTAMPKERTPDWYRSAHAKLLAARTAP